MFKGLLVITIALQLLIALTQTGWIRSVAELSAFLLVVLLSFSIKPASFTLTSEN
ncbi:MAG: hypothetical protein ACK5MF_09855 [Vibrio sp.]|uniref:hypothetical protein n=1 Tax=Vibrio sp. TaxID=678 RepID=UPI003A891112